MPTMFDVTPEELHSSANKIATLGDEWVAEVNSINAAVEELNVSYKGEANAQFNQQLAGYKNDFDAARKALYDYVNFVHDYANDISNVEADLKEQASRLSVGR
mgnify:FL=1